MFAYTFIIPHKNIPSLLKRCLDSIPSRPDIEIIVVDDNSDYKSKKELENISRDNLQIIYTTENKGAGYARNIGVSIARSKWVLFADADDFFLPNLLEKLDSYKDQTQSFVLFHSICRESNNLNKIGNRQRLCDSFSQRLHSFQMHELSAFDLFLGFGVPWAKMVQLSFLQEKKISFEEVEFDNDTGWITQIAIKATNKDIFVSDEKIYCLTDREKSLYHTRDYKSFCCRFGVFYRQHQVLLQNGFQSNFNFCSYVDQARKEGIVFLLRFYKHIFQSKYHITAVYSLEKKMHLKRPYFYLGFQIIKSVPSTLLKKFPF